MAAFERALTERSEMTTPGKGMSHSWDAIFRREVGARLDLIST